MKTPTDPNDIQMANLLGRGWEFTHHGGNCTDFRRGFVTVFRPDESGSTFHVDLHEGVESHEQMEGESLGDVARVAKEWAGAA